MKNILFIAPHPDDEVLGCGGTISKFCAEEKNVYVLVATRGASELFAAEAVEATRKEACDAHKFLGVSDTLFFEFEAPKLDVTPSFQIANAIAKVLRDLNIDTVYLPHRGDIHKDHRVIFEAALVAARPHPGASVKRILAYETLSETEWAAPFADDAFIPTWFENIEGYLENKINAMSFYASQLKEFPHSRSVETIEALARFRGSTVGVKAAEAFMLIREVNK